MTPALSPLETGLNLEAEQALKDFENNVEFSAKEDPEIALKNLMAQGVEKLGSKSIPEIITQINDLLYNPNKLGLDEIRKLPENLRNSAHIWEYPFRFITVDNGLREKIIRLAQKVFLSENK